MTEQPDRDSYHDYSVDAEDQPQGTEDSQVAGDPNVEDPLDEGYSPPEKWSAAERYGNTPREEALGESLDQRIEQEEPEPDPYAEAEAESVDSIEGRSEDEVTEVGDQRAGRLVDPDEGFGTDEEKDLVGEDVGIDGAGAGAEEAAVHVIDEDDAPD